MKPSTQRLWAVVSGPSFNGILGLDIDRFAIGQFHAAGTCFGAIYWRKKDAIEAAKGWGTDATVQAVVLSSPVRGGAA